MMEWNPSSQAFIKNGSRDTLRGGPFLALLVVSALESESEDELKS
jgi:hypothetical protein